MTLEWTTKYQSPTGYWRGVRSDSSAFIASSEEMFDAFLNPSCNCSLNQQEMKNCPIHKEFIDANSLVK